jgi:hypothetical protein
MNKWFSITEKHPQKNKIQKPIACPRCGTIIPCQGFPNENIILICPKCHTRGFYTFSKEKRGSIIETLDVLYNSIGYFITSALLLINHFIFYENQLILTITFICLTALFIIFNLDGKIPIQFAILMIILSAFSLTFYQIQSFANQLAIYSYYLLVVGITCLVIECFGKTSISKIKKMFG